ncbi:hypothetical protein NBRC10512_007970 [Rhodotorula toruloides]|uniref:RHTO0S04e02762g1_1 n=2 Tax=Rhodotorula toruloides TaxID=5286 RepID=A0A061APW9_RHOTO|nr:uncharacterized protein RHTO_02547 [Rhodotorula toruloides NP11]EMS20599.1 hypothetical protein RHTO_02547 [Rhodotorula toruloides NP11]CDR39201.1 RHTO0S04e02762g1_1 [Rhodotorula toruloides]
MATQTTTTKRRLIYSLPCRPPIPFPAQPSYPVHVPNRDLKHAYTDAMWPPADERQSEQATLEAFARSLLALLADRSPAEFDSLARELVLPLQDFDKRWRDHVPGAIAASEDDEDHSNEGLGEEEARWAREDYARWAVKEKARLEEERRKAEEKRRKGKQRALDQDGAAEQMDEDEDEAAPKEIVVRPDDWLSEKELLETRLQSLILLTLLSLPITYTPSITRKGKKKKHPELFRDTLDPAMLLDFLTDRMQIWRVMRDVGGFGIAAEGMEEVVVEEKDLVQVWWLDIVEPLFRTRVDSTILSHHRLKLFPSSATQAARLAQRLEPAPSPFKARSLLSLEKSARKREMREDERRVAQSPTMKRLMGLKGLGAGRKEKEEKETGGEDDDVFKIPVVPLKRKDSTDAPSDAASTAAPRPRLPRKQERPRPLPRGDNMAGVPDVLKRRVVSLSKKPSASSVAVKKKVASKADADDSHALKRKRKAVSPKKSTAADRAAHSLTLVPDTPSKSSSTSASFRKPFSRATSMPSFAALGAAFRAGAADAPRLPLPFEVPSPPPFGIRRAKGARALELNEEAGEVAYESDEEMNAAGGEADRMDEARDRLSTPKKQVVAQVLVPDT